MSQILKRSAGKTFERAMWEERTTGQAVLDQAFLDVRVPSLPQPQSRIKDMQHWIDLCA